MDIMKRNKKRIALTDDQQLDRQAGITDTFKSA